MNVKNMANMHLVANDFQSKGLFKVVANYAVPGMSLRPAINQNVCFVPKRYSMSYNLSRVNSAQTVRNHF